MKLVNFEEFCKMPAGTVFAPYKPCVLDGILEIKVDPGRDYYNKDGTVEHWFNGVMPLEPWFDYDCMLFKEGDEEEITFEVYDGDNNDYRDHKLFLVFDSSDIDKMIDVLKWAKNGCVGDEL